MCSVCEEQCGRLGWSGSSRCHQDQGIAGFRKDFDFCFEKGNHSGAEE